MFFSFFQVNSIPQAHKKIPAHAGITSIYYIITQLFNHDSRIDSTDIR